MAELEVDRGADVVVVVAEGVPEELEAPALVVGVPPDEPDEPEPDPVTDVEVLRVVPTAANPGICLDTTRPRAAAPPTATIATALDMRRTRALAMSRRLVARSPERAVFPPGLAMPASRLVGMLMGGMSPCESRGPRTAGCESAVNQRAAGPAPESSASVVPATGTRTVKTVPPPAAGPAVTEPP